MIKFLKMLVPDAVKPYITGVVYGWHGNYRSWQEAAEKCSGYDDKAIFEKVRSSAIKVRNGTAVYERDSVLFSEIQYSFPVLSGLMWIAAINSGNLRVLDFGGALGSTYFQNKKFLDKLSNVSWCIVEQPDFVEAGIKDFADNRLRFYASVEECMGVNAIDVVLLSSVLQYLERPYDLVEKIKSAGIRFILIDRTPLIKGPDRLTVQKVPSFIYPASYPCWFFNREKFIRNFTDNYELVSEFIALDKANINSEFKGFLFRKSENL